MQYQQWNVTAKKLIKFQAKKNLRYLRENHRLTAQLVNIDEIVLDIISAEFGIFSVFG